MKLTRILATRVGKRDGRSGTFQRRLEFESLERRQMLSLPAPGMFDGELEMIDDAYERVGLGFDVTVDWSLAQKYPLLQSNVEMATDVLSGLLGGYGSIDVLVRAGDLSQLDPVYATALAWTNGAESWFPAATSGVWQAGTIYEALNGVDLNGAGPDIILEFNPTALATDIWIDPAVGSNPAIPQNKEDCVSIAIHELLHGLGFTGFRMTTDGDDWGKFTQGKKSTYDALTDFGTGGLFGVGTSHEVVYFSGKNAVAEYGGLVPLNSVPHGFANFYHVGNGYGDGKQLYGDMMYATGAIVGSRALPSDLDLAILRDLGWKEPQWVRKEIEFDWSQLYVLPPIFPDPPFDPDFLDVDLRLDEADWFAVAEDPFAGLRQQEFDFRLDYDMPLQIRAADLVYERYGSPDPFATQRRTSPETALYDEGFGELVDYMAVTGMLGFGIS